MKIIKRVFSVFFVLIMLFSASACKDKGSVIDFTCFNTYVHIQTQSTSISKDTENKIKNLFSELEKEFDLKNQSSITHKFNQAPLNEIIPLGEHAVNVFSAINSAYNLTDGTFDPTVYPLTKLWGFAPYSFKPNFTPPTQEQINAELSKVGFDKIIFNAEQKTVIKTADVKLDFGGIVKGYAVDKASEILRADGHADGYINVGGSSLNILSVNNLGIRHPKKISGNSIISVKLSGLNNLSVSTSGDYEKFHKDADGNKYCHIINPSTGFPTTTGVSSVTVIGIDGAISDALTTAGCLKSVDVTDILGSPLSLFIKKVVQTYPSAQVFAVYENDNEKLILTNKTVDVDFTLLDSEYTVIKV